MQSNTIFNKKIIIRLITEISKQIPGVKKVFINPEDIDVENHNINIKLQLHEKIFNVKNTSIEFQKTIYQNLVNKKYPEELKINIEIIN